MSENMIYMCRSCCTVLGDSLSVCGTNDSLKVIACLRVTNEVVMDKGLHIMLDGDLNGCAYYPLHCRSCETRIGFTMYTAFRIFSCLRGLFCLQKEQITCYVLNSRKIFPGLELDIKPPILGGHIKELKEGLVNLHLQVELLNCQLGHLPVKSVKL
ncbi:protein Mis18-beta [Spea bombifrons]|uniref:protein Mis18-beta n=1 Tax=Spea bombifrons TaxID=233779 RepID=UPI002349BCBD|nr:protein Mis18-beta [Spea bombifrons]